MSTQQLAEKFKTLIQMMVDLRCNGDIFHLGYSKKQKLQIQKLNQINLKWFEDYITCLTIQWLY